MERGKLLPAMAALAIAALAGGYFQPLYGERSLTGGPVLRDQLSAVDIIQIEAPKGSDEARLAVEIRNALLFDFSGGGSAAPPTHRLKIAMSSTRAAIIVDVNTSRPDIENYGINATYSLTEIATAKVDASPGCPMTSPAKRSGLPGYADCATPKPARPR